MEDIAHRLCSTAIKEGKPMEAEPMVLWRIYRLETLFEADSDSEESAVVQDTGSDPGGNAGSGVLNLGGPLWRCSGSRARAPRGGRTLRTIDGLTDTRERLPIHAWVVN